MAMELLAAVVRVVAVAMDLLAAAVLVVVVVTPGVTTTAAVGRSLDVRLLAEQRSHADGGSR